MHLEDVMTQLHVGSVRSIHVIKYEEDTNNKLVGLQCEWSPEKRDEGIHKEYT